MIARDEIARVLSDNWRNMNTNESLGRQKMLADAVIDHLLSDKVMERAAEAVYTAQGLDSPGVVHEHERESAREIARAALNAALGVK